MENVFDSPGFYDALKAADVPEKQARAQAEAMRSAFAAYDANRMKELATKGDIRDLRLEMQQMKISLIKWFVVGMLTLGAFLAAVIFGAFAVLPQMAGFLRG